MYEDGTEENVRISNPDKGRFISCLVDEILLHDFIIDENNCGHIKWKGQEFTTNPFI